MSATPTTTNAGRREICAGTNMPFSFNSAVAAAGTRGVLNPRAGNAWPRGGRPLYRLGRQRGAGGASAIRQWPNKAERKCTTAAGFGLQASGRELSILADELAVGAKQIEHGAIEFPTDALFALEDHLGTLSPDLPRQHRHG